MSWKIAAPNFLLISEKRAGRAGPLSGDTYVRAELRPIFTERSLKAKNNKTREAANDKTESLEKGKVWRQTCDKP